MRHDAALHAAQPLHTPLLLFHAASDARHIGFRMPNTKCWPLRYFGIITQNVI